MSDPSFSDSNRTGVQQHRDTEPPFQDILIPIDGSDAVWDGIKSISPLTSLLSGTVHALYVHPEGTFHRDKLRSDPKEEGQTVVEEFDQKLSSSDLQTTTAVRSGVPEEEITAYADEQDIDLLVMVSHSDSPLEILQKSTTETVLKRSDRPLLAIHQ